jgi:hypothetical protein
MNHVNTETTNPDFVQFKFENVALAAVAERCFPVDFVRTGETIIEYRDGPRIDAIREGLSKEGIAWTEAASTLTEDDMWPEWPEDSAPSM